jgi:hypothetical protein
VEVREARDGRATQLPAWHRMPTAAPSTMWNADAETVAGSAGSRPREGAAFAQLTSHFRSVSKIPRTAPVPNGLVQPYTYASVWSHAP